MVSKLSKTLVHRDVCWNPVLELPLESCWSLYCPECSWYPIVALASPVLEAVLDQVALAVEVVSQPDLSTCCLSSPERMVSTHYSVQVPRLATGDNLVSGQYRVIEDQLPHTQPLALGKKVTCCCEPGFSCDCSSCSILQDLQWWEQIFWATSPHLDQVAK